ncbi:MAG: GNAT family N-acetyltransferase [Cyanobacteria bacterium SBLK]|nr:GNAT family N-acetyltransferase [Cyanobacteria bacterium SBLK]
MQTQLFDIQENCYSNARIVEISDRHVLDFEEYWIPKLEELGEEDQYWDWAFKKRMAFNEDNIEGYAIECNNTTQGLLSLETRFHRSWLDETQKIVYIKAIASASWNRSSVPRQRYKFVGKRLISFARQRSAELGYFGRIGLHSLDNAIEFYRKLSMWELGRDPDCDDLIYFELGQL